ncbi:MAG: putative baseplate assembly protein [Rhizobacter sp.]
MTLPIPTLDTLRYDALLREATDLLPYRAPNWTDHNAHDPGITLLELFAWAAEANSYRLDRIPTRSERAFLRLLGYPMRPAQVARTVLAFEAQGAAVQMPAAVQVSNANAGTRFQTGTPFDVVTARIVALLTSSASGWAAHDTASGFLPLGAKPAVDDALYIGFDRALAPVGGRVRLFMLSDDPARDENTWAELHAEHRRVRRCGSGHAGERRFPLRSSASRSMWTHHGALVAWEYFNGTSWQTLPGLCDATRALSLSGPLRFRVPADMQPGNVPGQASPWFIRCRLRCGEYDCAPRLSALLLNAVLARHAADEPVLALGISNGQAQQRFDLSRDPIVPGSTQLTLTLPDGTPSAWEERPDFDRSGSLARHHVIDPAWGQIVFGDGRAGRVPEASATVSARWKTGGGPSGNVSAKAITVPPATLPITVQQPVAAWGGAEAETLGAAKARAVRAIAQARCAVTLQDFEHAAMRVPGAPVARAHAVPEFDPKLGCLAVAGCVTLVVVSPCVRSQPDPTPALCRAVRCYLDSRRPVATEVQVSGPEWKEIAVKAVLRARRGIAVASLRAEAARRIDAFFDPLEGGPDGTGWPFGRAVFRTEVMALLDTLPGVLAIEGLALIADDRPEDLCNNIALCPHGLVRPGLHQITVSPETTR